MFRGEEAKKILEAISVLGEDATPKQIAEHTEIPIKTVYTVLFRLKKTTSEEVKNEVKTSEESRAGVPSFAQDMVFFTKKEYASELADVVKVVKDKSNTKHIPIFRGKSGLVTDEKWLRKWLDEHSLSLEDVFERWESFPKEGSVEKLNSIEELFNLAGDKVLLDVEPQFQNKLGKQIILLRGGEKQNAGIREMYPGELALILKSNGLRFRDVFTRWRVWR